MTRFERLRDFLMGELFARVVVLLLFGWVLIQWTALHNAEQRADSAEQRAVDAEAQLRHIKANCVRNDVGEGQCRAGTFVAPTTTTTVAK